MPAKIHQFPCLSDNFGVLIHDPATGATASIDAPEAAAVEKALQDTGWTLTDILVTHHHADHTQGIPELKAKHKCRVTAPKTEASRIADVDATYAEGDAYPRPPFAGKLTIRSSRPDLGPYVLTMDHLTTGYVRLKPGSGVTANAKLRVSVDGPDYARGPEATLVVGTADGAQT